MYDWGENSPQLKDLCYPLVGENLLPILIRHKARRDRDNIESDKKTNPNLLDKNSSKKEMLNNNNV